jgi:iron complex transport system substrate-binding protein
VGKLGFTQGAFVRIASLISAGTEMLFALGLGEQVVAVSHECDWPAECKRLPRVTRSNVNSAAASGVIDCQVCDLMAAGKPLYEIDAVRLAELRPDLIVTQAQCDVCAVRYADVLEVVGTQPALHGACVFALNPQSLADVLNDLQRIAAAANVQGRGEQVVAELRLRIERVRDKSAKIPRTDWPRVAIIEWTEPLMLAGNWVPELVELAGGRCELTKAGEHSRCYQWEELLKFDPQAIVVCPCGFDLARARLETEELSRRPGWQAITAVKMGRVFPLDGNAYFNRPGPRFVESLERLSELLHPV